MPAVKPNLIQKLKFYLWVALVWYLLWIISYWFNYPETFFARTINEFWRDSYLLAVNFIFFEYAWPFIGRKRKYFIYNIVLFLFFLWILMMIVSFGLYAWRQTGIAIGLYTPLRSDETINHAVAFQTQAGVMSLFFFGIIRHVYNYRQLQQAAQQLRIEKQQAELNYLKSQTNPH